MSALLSIFVDDLVPVFAIATAGFWLARYVGASVKTVSHVVFYVALPCMVFNMLMGASHSGLNLGRMVWLGLVMTAAMGLVAMVAARVLGLDRVGTRALLLVAMFSNTGNYGLPVVRFAFGDTALAYATAFFLTGSVLTYTVGAFLGAGARGTAGVALGRIARMPAIYGMLLAFAMVGMGWEAPVALMRPVGMLADASLPLMMLVLGMQLEQASIPDNLGVVGSAVGVSLVAAPLVALGITRLFGITGAERQVVVMLSSMPVAVSTTIVAVEFDLWPEFVTSAVFVSTLASPLTLTGLIAYLR